MRAWTGYSQPRRKFCLKTSPDNEPILDGVSDCGCVSHCDVSNSQLAAWQTGYLFSFMEQLKANTSFGE